MILNMISNLILNMALNMTTNIGPYSECVFVWEAKYDSGYIIPNLLLNMELNYDSLFDSENDFEMWS